MKILWLLFIFLLSSSAFAGEYDKVDCKGSGCWSSDNSWVDNQMLGCRVQFGQVCNITATNDNGDRECRKVTNWSIWSGDIFVPGLYVVADENRKNWQKFVVGTAGTNITVGPPNVCDQSTVPCDSANVSWIVNGVTCSGAVEARAYYQTAPAVDNDLSASTGTVRSHGDATFRCNNSAWEVTDKSCIADCPAATITWGNCSASIGNNSNGSNANLTDPSPPNGGSDVWYGTVGVTCNSGSWTITTQACNQYMAPCAARSIGWSSCQGSLPAGNHGDAPAIGNTVVGYSGSANFTCNNGTWNQTGSSCNMNCPSGTSPGGAGDSIPSNPSCKCNTAAESFCPTTLGCDSTCPAGTSTTGAGGSANPAACKCNAGGYNWNGSSCVISCPSGSSPSGGGAGTSTAGCSCDGGTPYWSGSSCYSCPSGTSPSGAGAAASPASCKCATSGYTWNGSSCVAPALCDTNAILSCDTYACPTGSACGATNNGSAGSCDGECQTMQCASGVIRLKQVPASCMCFVAGTPVTMGDGSTKAIEKVLNGEMVKTFNEKENTFTVSKVVKVLHHAKKAQTLYDFTFEDGRRVTSNGIHPIFIVELNAYAHAWQIHNMFVKGQSISVMTQEGTQLHISSVKKRRMNTRTYNLHVKGPDDTDVRDGKVGHNYFANGVLVHNIKVDTR